MLLILRHNFLLLVENCDIFRRFKRCTICFLLSQCRPENPGIHEQKYPVDPFMTHDPLFRHGEDEQISTKMVKISSVR